MNDDESGAEWVAGFFDGTEDTSRLDAIRAICDALGCEHASGPSYREPFTYAGKHYAGSWLMIMGDGRMYAECREAEGAGPTVDDCIVRTALLMVANQWWSHIVAGEFDDAITNASRFLATVLDAEAVARGVAYWTANRLTERGPK